MNAEKLYSELKEDKIRSIYYLYGADEYLKQESYNRLTGAVLESGIKDFNCDIFFGGEVNVDSVITAANTFPVMAERRLVVLKDANRLTAGDEESLLSYISNPSPYTTLIMVGSSVDKRKKFFSSLGKNNALVDHSPPYENEMPKWIKWIAKKKNVSISAEAVRCLVDIVGNDLGSIENEIEKASIYLGDRQTIELEDIEAVTVDVKEITIFQFIDAIGNKDLAASLKKLNKIMDSGMSPLLIISMIARQMRLIWVGIDTLKKGGTDSDLRKKVRLPTGAFRNYRRQLKLFKEAEIKKAFNDLTELDLKFKSTAVDKGKSLELFAFKLCGY